MDGKAMWKSLTVFCLFVGAATAACPSDASGLQSFQALYPAPTTSTNVSITSPTLLDVTSVNVNLIVISGTGQLIFKPGNSITIRTRGIRIKDNGVLIIGNESCRFEDNVDIALYGSRTVDRSLLSHGGEKSITVEDAGSIKIYGKDKLSWTKLTSTVPIPAPIYRHQTDGSVNSLQKGSEGIALTVFDSSFNRLSYKAYDFWKGDAAKERTQINKLKNALDAVTEGQVVAISLQNFLKHTKSVQADMNSLYDKIETVAGMTANSLYLRTSGKYDAFALVFEKGASYDQAVDEHIGKAEMFARASIEAHGKKVSATSGILIASKTKSLIDVQINSLTDGYPVLNLVHDVSNSWEIGDSLLVASTDHAWNHAEVRKIKSFPSANSVKLDHEFNYRHFGAIEHGVDMRAEVALLSRNIKIHGEMTAGDCPAVNENCNKFDYDSYGCHIKILHSFAFVHIEGTEIFQCGQPSDKGSYPIHFHMCKNVTDLEAVVKRNSIRDCYQRAVTVHGTYGSSETALGVEVIENVAYNILGHAYFLEDGAEKATAFIGNLAASVREVDNGFFATDANQVSAFWITGPQTVLKDNVAAGSEGIGYWYIMPYEPVGPSKSLGVYEYGEAFRTAFYTFDNNVAHSNFRDGLFIDAILANEDGDLISKLKYNPRKDPKDENSAIDQSFLYRFTAYKNTRINVWIRGGSIVMIQCSLAESKRSVQFATGSSEPQYMSKSVIMGESEGNGEYDGDYPDAYGKSSGGIAAFDHYIGYSVYDGPVWVEDIYFVGFKSKPDRSILAGAIGFNPTSEFFSSPINPVKNMIFGGSDPAEENWVFDGTINDTANGFGNEDGDEVATFRDADGSVIKCDGVTPTPPYQIYKPEKFLITDRTVYRANWQMVYSTDMYGKLNPRVLQPTVFDRHSQMKRINRLDTTDTAYEDCTGVNNKEFMVVLNRTEKYYYQFQYTNGCPTEIKLESKGVESEQDFIVGFCLPTGTTKDDITVILKAPTYNSVSGSSIQWVDDIASLEADTTMSKAMLKDRFLYAHFVNPLTRDPTWDKFDDEECPGRSCPTVTIKMNDGAPTSYTPCFSATTEELNTDYVIPDTIEDCVKSAGVKEADWGVGDTFADKDGGWRDWGSWDECCNTDPANPVQTTRYRTCTNPPPYGNGKQCSGSASETKDCPTVCSTA